MQRHEERREEEERYSIREYDVADAQRLTRACVRVAHITQYTYRGCVQDLCTVQFTSVRLRLKSGSTHERHIRERDTCRNERERQT